MSPPDVYGLVARIGGLVFWVFAAFDLVHALASYFHVPIPAKYSVSTDVVVAATWVVLGIALTLCADALTRLAYRTGSGRRS
jgi:hypothetical protein